MRQGVEGLPRERDDSNMCRLESQYAENKVLSNEMEARLDTRLCRLHGFSPSNDNLHF